MHHPLIRFISDFGDAAVLLPVALVLLGWLWLAKARNAAVVWLFAFGGTVSAIAFLKLGLGLCGRMLLGAPSSPSGHMALSTVVYGALTVVAVRRMAITPWRWAVWSGTIGWITMIGVSRVRIGAHTPAEVMTGCIVGGLGLLAFAVCPKVPTTDSLRLRWALVAALAVLALLHGNHAEAEAPLQFWVQALEARFAWCR
jgi:membrane-associated phospholipid phosphatase